MIDLASGKVVDRLPSGPDPELMALHPDGHHLYIANEDDNMVTVLDIDSKKVLNEIQVGVEPEGMGISPDGKLLVNTSETTNMAHFIDTDSREIIGNVLVDSRPRVAEFTPDNKHVWVSAEIGGTVSVIDSAEKKVIHKIRFEIPGVSADAIQPVGVKITKDGKRAFVALGWLPGRRDRPGDLRGEEVRILSASASGTWRWGRTRPGSIPPTASAATCR